jgi:UDP-2,3-diacylglucosamine hydrolase
VAETLFISDLHLSGARPDRVQLFIDFAQQRAPQADRLYILGDLFDVWIGDDLEQPPIPRIKAALRQLTEAGTRVRLMHGNRDFLIGPAFCAQTGLELLPDPTRITLQGIPTLLMHGDLLCSDDQTYQAFRQEIRKPEIMQAFLSLPMPQRLRTAAEYRAKSGEANSLKAADIMDVNQQTVERYMRQQGASRLIHGHTHRPGLHRFDLDGQPARRYVLADWHARGAELLRVGTDGWQREWFSPR